MKKFTYLLFLAIGVTACSVESVDSTENLMTADAKFSSQVVEKSMTLKSEEICEGDAPVFVFNFPQNQNGPHNASTDIKIQIETFPGSGEWVPFDGLIFSGAGPEEHTYTAEVLAVGTYNFRAKIGKGGYDYLATLNVINCCVESFSYIDNGDGSYTFTYVPEEDMEDALLVFTLAQSDTDTGLEGWEDKGETKQKTMDLEACVEYSWIVTLTPKCPGGTTLNNAWTDFKVNDFSKKGDLKNIKLSCN